MEKRGVADLVGFLDEGLDVGFEFAEEAGFASGGWEGGAALKGNRARERREVRDAKAARECGEGGVSKRVSVAAEKERRGKAIAGGDA